jgi:hypothetical protein
MAAFEKTRGEQVDAPRQGKAAPRLVCLGALAIAVVVACGDRTGLPDPPLHCVETAQKVVEKVPNLYFILDRSTSMNENPGGGPDKWSVVRTDIANLMVSLGKKAEFGAAVFPPPPPEPTHDVMLLCAAGQQVMPLKLGDGLPATTAGSTAEVFISATSATPNGGTPTAATFVALKDTLAGFPGHTFAILATDGGPNCDFGLSCSVDQCTLNIDHSVPQCTPGGANCCAEAPFDCLDGPDTVAAVSALAAAGVPTFAIGVPGSEAYASVLDQVAQAGGTARSTEPYYYPVKTAQSTSLVDALTNIAARITACTLELKNPPPDPSQVNVVLGQTPVLPGAGGWSLTGSIVSLEGATCDAAIGGAKVTITFGCPTVE